MDHRTKNPLGELDAELRCLDWDDADTMERAVIDTAHGLRTWTDRLSRDETLQGAVTAGGESYGVTDGRYRHRNGLLWWPTGVVRRANLRNGRREAWVIGIACDAFALVCRYAGEAGRRRVRTRIHRIYVSGDFHFKNATAEAERAERVMGEWYIAPAHTAFASSGSWSPLWIEPKGSIAKQWVYSGQRTDLTRDAANALRSKNRSTRDEPPHAVLWTPGDDPAWAIGTA